MSANLRPKFHRQDNSQSNDDPLGESINVPLGQNVKSESDHILFVEFEEEEKLQSNVKSSLHRIEKASGNVISHRSLL